MTPTKLLVGQPWFVIFSYPVYVPWRLFEWWYAFDAYAPSLFNHAGMIAASSGFAGIGVAVAGSLWRARQNRLVTTYGSSRWATAREIERAGLFRDAGVFVGQIANRYLRHDGPEHVMAFAPSRSGKGVGLVVPTLLSWMKVPPSFTTLKEKTGSLQPDGVRSFLMCFCSIRLIRVQRSTIRYWKSARGLMKCATCRISLIFWSIPKALWEQRNHWEKTSHSLLVEQFFMSFMPKKKKPWGCVATFLSDPDRSFVNTLRATTSTNHLGTIENPKGSSCCRVRRS